jgi:cation diffusion facilitator CzcD-associated flavoprotein CzcO
LLTLKLRASPGRSSLLRRARSREEGAAVGGSRYLGPDYDIDTHFTPKYRP